jgi:hypothetical protein
LISQRPDTLFTLSSRSLAPGLWSFPTSPRKNGFLASFLSIFCLTSSTMVSWKVDVVSSEVTAYAWRPTASHLDKYFASSMAQSRHLPA